MLRDVFYFNTKPNTHPRERFAENLEQARLLATTEHFWIINEFCDYRNFDWDFDYEFLPDEDVWAEDHNNVWPSQHQKDSGTWLCPKEFSNVIIYRNDVAPITRKNEKDSGNWIELDLINHSKFDFSWHPDPTDPPYIYKWGCKFFPAELKHVLEYHVPGATQEKYMNTIAELIPEYDRWVEHQEVDKSRFDFSWRPNPLDPPFIYVWGNKYIDGKLKPTLEYHTPSATDKKYMPELVSVLPATDKWNIIEDVEISSFDFNWRPDPTSPPYIYAWGNQWNNPEDKITIEFVVPGATEYKYMTDKAMRKPCLANWVIPKDVDTLGFDFSWEPSPAAAPYIYEFGTQWQKTGGPQYVVPGATEKQYIDFQTAKKLPSLDNWNVPDNIDTAEFDFSWHPDDTSPPYTYVFATQWAFSGGPVYMVEGATEIKYVDEQTATAMPNRENWEYNPKLIDEDSFDFSWHPYVEDQPYIYEFGTQHQKTGGPKYIAPGADSSSPVKYIDTRILQAIRLPNKDDPCWVNHYPIKEFDYSWHPDNTEEPYIYMFGNSQYLAEECVTIEYRTPDATTVKYIPDIIAKLDVVMDKWVIPEDLDTSAFDFSWIPNPNEPAYIYEFGTQHQKTGGPRYVVPGAWRGTKYVDVQQAVRVSNKQYWTIPDNIDTTDFDFSWHPDATEPAYIYQFGTQWALTGGPQYVVEDATEIKYVDLFVAKALPDKTNWVYDPMLIDEDSFDFSWHPYIDDKPYIYEFATQWQKSGGPKYVMPGAWRGTKYVDDQTAKRLPDYQYWTVPDYIDKTSFDFSWHPDVTEEPYIYVFATQWAFSGGPVYTVPGATEIKYVEDQVATALPDKTNWEYDPMLIDEDSFDFSWHPYVEDQPYIYEFGTQHQKTGGPKYITPGADSSSPKKYIDTRIMQAVRLPNKDDPNWNNLYNIKEFDYSWHPDNTEDPYIYVFGNNQYLAEECTTVEYRIPNATTVKYIPDIIATLDVDMDKWVIPEDVDTSDFDFSWIPNPSEPPYIYEFGTQWQKTGGPKYVMAGAWRGTKYVDTQKSIRTSSKQNWTIPSYVDKSSFDFSWHPDATEPAYVYVFATQWAFSGGPVYTVPGATEIKYVEEQVATAEKDMTNWECDPKLIDFDKFDFSWHPYVDDQPYIYEFGTQWQKTGGPKYITPGADSSSPVKYIDTRIMQAVRLPNRDDPNWKTLYNIKDFDYSWHPDNTEDPYIYVFGNNQYLAEECATVEYHAPQATTMKYIPDIIATLDVDMDKWVIPENLDTSAFDFSWIPNPSEPAYIYEFGTQWQKTGGPKYVMAGAWRGTKYVDSQTATILPNTNDWVIPDNIDTTDFDFSWHPDATEPAYIYQFGTQWALTGGPKYVVAGATEVKYMDLFTATALPDTTNWEYDSKLIDVDKFDWSWHPYVEDQPYIYEFGTQHQKTGGPKYITPGADSNSPTKYIDTRILQAVRLPNKDDPNWNRRYPIKDFDYSWHPDETEEPYLYVFGNNQFLAEECATVEYRIPDATTIKYIPDIIATLDVVMDNWVIPEDIDATDFDFSWIPNPSEPAYIYEFGTQWQKTGGPKYVMPGAWRGTKYVDVQTAKMLPKKDNWVIPTNVDTTDFDFTWHPDTTEPAYIYQFGTQWALTGGPQYVVEGATEIKYMDNLFATAIPDKTNWVYDDKLIDIDSFDFSWHPYAGDEPYIYQFGTQWQKIGGPKYIAPGADNSSPVKYIDTRIIKATRLPNENDTLWVANYPIKDFDYSWHADETEEPYIYVFGNTLYPAEECATIEYRVPGATQVKYVHETVATLAANMDNWEVPENIDTGSFDFSWVPHPKSPPYIYEFATIWNDRGGPKYIVPGATENFYVEDIKASTLPSRINWEISDEIDVSTFDFSWVPHPLSPPYIYEFGTQWQKTGGPKYVTPGADSSSPIKYIDTHVSKVKRLPNRNKFKVLGGVKIKDFDWSWHPDDTSPPYIYLFGNNWYSAEEMPTIEFRVDGATEAKFIDDIVANLAPNHSNWEVHQDIDVTRFDFSWLPHPSATPYIYQFGTSADPSDGPRYIVPGNEGEIINVPRVEIDIDIDIDIINDEEVQQIVIHDDSVTEELVISVNETMDMFFVDRGNSESVARFEALRAKYGTRIQKTRYLNSWVDTINRCTNRATSELIWILNSELDYSDFNFDYYPNPWQMKMVHVFGTQWSHWGTTFMINRETFSEDTKYIKIIEHLSNLNFVKDIRAKATKCVHDIVVVDHGNKETSDVVSTLQKKAPDKTVTTTKYNNSYLDTLKDIIKRLPEKKEHFIWVCSGVCDYTNFDFTYVIDPFARDNLHVFPSGKQKFGDTFFIDVNNAREVIGELEQLENFTKVNYNGAVKAERLPEPIIVISDDTHTGSVDKITDFPYVTLITSDNSDIGKVDVEPMNLWSTETKNIYVTSTGATRIVIPKEVKDHVTKELYEYPYIKRAPKLALSKPLDIVFLSNGETGADENYEHLLNVAKGLPNRVVRVDGVNGRAAAYHAAAEASETPWMFTVFAKLKVSPKFDWNWQPDRMQSPKHYIFHAKNPVNRLIYGHQAMIAYNKKLTLANDGKGLDFTLDNEHEVVPLISGTAHYNTDEFSTWRTAFREVIKLRADDSEVSKERLDAWLNKAEGDFAQYSIKGALDADEYYDDVDGDFDQLKLSYEWVWLKEKFDQI